MFYSSFKLRHHANCDGRAKFYQEYQTPLDVIRRMDFSVWRLLETESHCLLWWSKDAGVTFRYLFSTRKLDIHNFRNCLMWLMFMSTKRKWWCQSLWFVGQMMNFSYQLIQGLLWKLSNSRPLIGQQWFIVLISLVES